MSSGRMPSSSVSGARADVSSEGSGRTRPDAFMDRAELMVVTSSQMAIKSLWYLKTICPACAGVSDTERLVQWPARKR